MAFTSPLAVVAPAPATTDVIETATVKEFIGMFGFIQINPSVSTNVNGYPFVTFINAQNVAENVYFSKKLASKYPKGTPIGAGFFNSLQIAKTSNVAGETRFKICSTGGSRLTLMDIL